MLLGLRRRLVGSWHGNQAVSPIRWARQCAIRPHSSGKMILKRTGSSIDRNLASLIWPLRHTVTPPHWPVCPHQTAHALGAGDVLRAAARDPACSRRSLTVHGRTNVPSLPLDPLEDANPPRRWAGSPHARYSSLLQPMITMPPPRPPTRRVASPPPPSQSSAGSPPAAATSALISLTPTNVSSACSPSSSNTLACLRTPWRQARNGYCRRQSTIIAVRALLAR
jgi:hypothetical protein